MNKQLNEALRQRFEAYLPKYGTLWKTMLPRESFLDAIENKVSIKLNVLQRSNPCQSVGCCDEFCSSSQIEHVEAISLNCSDDNARKRRDTSSSSESSFLSKKNDLTLESYFSQLRVEYDEEQLYPRLQHTLSPTKNSKFASLSSPNISSSTSFCSGGDTVVAFDLSHLVLDDNVDKLSGETSNINLNSSKGDLPVMIEMVDSRLLHSEKNSLDENLNFGLQECNSRKTSFSLEHVVKGINSSDSLAINPFELSNLQEDKNNGDNDDSDMEIWVPKSRPQIVLGEDQLVDTPSEASFSSRAKSRSFLFGIDDVARRDGSLSTNEDEANYETSSIDTEDTNSTLGKAKPKSGICGKSVTERNKNAHPFEKENYFTGKGSLEPRRFVKLKDPVPVIKFPENKNSKNCIESNTAYGRHFRKNRDSFTIEIFKNFNDKVFNRNLSDVKISWSKKLRTTAGITRCSRIKTNPERRCAEIELSVKVIDDYQRLRHTLLHEMCHAAQWLIDGKVKPAHGSCFKKWANIAMAKIEDVTVTTTHDFAIQYKYAWACSTETCDAVFQRQSKSIDVNKQVCGKCKGRLVEINVPERNVKKVNIDRTPKLQKELNGYAQFVKNNAKQVRRELEKNRTDTCVSQSEVMRACAKLWSDWKHCNDGTVLNEK